jgi:hypothetical protein
MTRMVHLLCVQQEFHARVITARLGSDGIFTEVRPPLGGPYPLPGEVHLYVGEDDVQLARALLSADEHQARMGPGDVDGGDVDGVDIGGVDIDGLDGGGEAMPPFFGVPARLALAILVLTSMLLLALTRAG